ncbi:putative permease [Candidatus Liberibacter americanus str. Sao Paulo]|uniref:Putative permease n=2 Tax=Candidatus Liberibacter americanus TaxID=309868 RepID=U6B5X0_9HYPH|nr:putative permease [Candidatus Liberibacter americanus str. Sao Paulo]
MWGLTPLYTQFLEHVPYFEVIIHRVLWSLPGVFLAFRCFSGDMASLKYTVKNTKVLLMLILSATLLACHWGVFIYALLAGRGFETSLSFFITPIISIALGTLFLKEKMSKMQVAATIITVTALLIMTFYKGLPFLSLSIAITWSSYCFTRKTIAAKSIDGFLLEMFFLSIPSIIIAVWLYNKGESHFLNGFSDTMLLVGYGIINSIVFCVFSYAIKITKLSTVGIMEYLAPIVMMINTIFVLKQPISKIDIIVFILIFVSLLIYILPVVLTNKETVIKSKNNKN